MVKIPVVDENDEVIMYKERDEIQPEDIYRVSSLWVMNEFWEFLLTQRSALKRNDPNKWTCAVAGTVEEGESYEDNIIKETKEEIWMDIKDPQLLAIRRRKGNHHYFWATHLVNLPKDSDFVFDEEEIQKVGWFSIEKIDEWFSLFPNDFVPSFWETWPFVKEKLKELEL